MNTLRAIVTPLCLAVLCGWGVTACSELDSSPIRDAFLAAALRADASSCGQAVLQIEAVILDPAVADRPLTGSLHASTEEVVWDVIGLPTGVSLDPASGLLTGRPRTAGTFDLEVVARHPVCALEERREVALEVAPACPECASTCAEPLPEEPLDAWIDGIPAGADLVANALTVVAVEPDRILFDRPWSKNDPVLNYVLPAGFVPYWLRGEVVDLRHVHTLVGDRYTFLVRGFQPTLTIVRGRDSAARIRQLCPGSDAQPHCIVDDFVRHATTCPTDNCTAPVTLSFPDVGPDRVAPGQAIADPWGRIVRVASARERVDDACEVPAGEVAFYETAAPSCTVAEMEIRAAPAATAPTSAWLAGRPLFVPDGAPADCEWSVDPPDPRALVGRIAQGDALWLELPLVGTYRIATRCGDGCLTAHQSLHVASRDAARVELFWTSASANAPLRLEVDGSPADSVGRRVLALDLPEVPPLHRIRVVLDEDSVSVAEVVLRVLAGDQVLTSQAHTLTPGASWTPTP